MNGLKNLVGERFGRLRVEERAPSVGGRTAWRCVCECGQSHVTRATSLLSGDAQSCGCLSRELRSKMFKTHGAKRTRLYSIWGKMKSRCNSPSNPQYSRYGGRGIAVCDEWVSFEGFRDWSLVHRYDSKKELHRKHNDRGYCPNNCVWWTKSKHSAFHMREKWRNGSFRKDRFTEIVP